MAESSPIVSEGLYICTDFYPNPGMIYFFYFMVGLGLLILGGSWLLKAAVDLSLRMAVPKIIIGMTVVSFATSAPELIVSLQAALEGYPDLALSNVVGSNVANLGLILSITLFLGHLDVRRSFYFTDWPVMMLASLMTYGFMFADSQLDSWEGGVMVISLFLFLIYLLRYQKTAVEADSLHLPSRLPLYQTVFFLGAGGVGLWGGSELLITGAEGLALQLGVSDRLIGITLVSVGTSIPEMAASVIAMIRKEKAISVGNLIGSNIFNLLAVLGITALVQPITAVDERLLSQDIYWMLGISFLILPLVFFPRGRRLDWIDGLVLLAAYGAFLWQNLM